MKLNRKQLRNLLLREMRILSEGKKDPTQANAEAYIKALHKAHTDLTGRERLRKKSDLTDEYGVQGSTYKKPTDKSSKIKCTVTFEGGKKFNVEIAQ